MSSTVYTPTLKSSTYKGNDVCLIKKSGTAIWITQPYTSYTVTTALNFGNLYTITYTFSGIYCPFTVKEDNTTKTITTNSNTYVTSARLYTTSNKIIQLYVLLDNTKAPKYIYSSFTLIEYITGVDTVNYRVSKTDYEVTNVNPCNVVVSATTQEVTTTEDSYTEYDISATVTNPNNFTIDIWWNYGTIAPSNPMVYKGTVAANSSVVITHSSLSPGTSPFNVYVGGNTTYPGVYNSSSTTFSF